MPGGNRGPVNPPYRGFRGHQPSRWGQIGADGDFSQFSAPDGALAIPRCSSAETWGLAEHGLDPVSISVWDGAERGRATCSRSEPGASEHGRPALLRSMLIQTCRESACVSPYPMT